MAVKWQRPVLVGGIGLSFALWLLQSLHHSVAQLGEYGVWGAITLSTGLWLFQQLGQTKTNNLPPTESPLDRAMVEKAIAQAEGLVSQLAAEAENHEAKVELQQRVAQLQTELDRQEIRLVITGGQSVGKTTLMQVLKSSWVPQQQLKLSLQETPALFTNTNSNQQQEAALAAAVASDLVLFVTNGDLTDSELQALQQLTAANQRVVVVFNKQDQYLPEERTVVLQALQQRLKVVLGAGFAVGIAAAPNPIKVCQHQPDGSMREWLEQPTPQTELLTNYITQILVQEGQQLVWATTYRTAVALKQEAKRALNEVRRNRALPVIEQYQWITAATAFANPVPALDLLAAAAINTQLVIELGAIYQQKISLQQAQTVAGTLGSLMVKLGLVELSTQTIGSILKSNAITFMAGGALQGVSAAYLTRLAGVSLIEYFQEQDTVLSSENRCLLNPIYLRRTLQRVFQQNQQVAFLQSFVKTISQKLTPGMT